MISRHSFYHQHSSWGCFHQCCKHYKDELELGVRMMIRYWGMGRSSLLFSKANALSDCVDMERIIVLGLESDGDYDSQQYYE